MARRATMAGRPSPPAAGGFPWPPRPYSEQVNLPRSLFGSARTLGEADAHLGQVLSAAGYRNFRYYPLPQQPGYALVTRFEQIKKSYELMPETARWSLNTTPCPDFSLLCVAHSLVFPTSGYWRVFVFVVTERPLPAPVGDMPGWEEGQSWFGKGTNLLPEALRDEPLTAKHYVAMLVYEFYKQEGQAVVMLSQCRLDGVAQLQRAGVRY